MVTDLKIRCKNYDRRVSLALIPFYKERLDYISNELSKKTESLDDNAQKEADYLKKILQTVKKDKEREVKALNKMAKNIYKLWKDIQQERIKEQCQKTTYCLKVY